MCVVALRLRGRPANPSSLAPFDAAEVLIAYRWDCITLISRDVGSWPIAAVREAARRVGSQGRTGRLQPSARSTLLTRSGRPFNITATTCKGREPSQQP